MMRWAHWFSTQSWAKSVMSSLEMLEEKLI